MERSGLKAWNPSKIIIKKGTEVFIFMSLADFIVLSSVSRRHSRLARLHL